MHGRYTARCQLVVKFVAAPATWEFHSETQSNVQLEMQIDLIFDAAPLDAFALFARDDAFPNERTRYERRKDNQEMV
jgi:hypothetical protein